MKLPQWLDIFTNFNKNIIQEDGEAVYYEQDLEEEVIQDMTEVIPIQHVVEHIRGNIFVCEIIHIYFSQKNLHLQ